MLTALLIAGLVVAGLNGYAAHQSRAWATREITPILGWPAVLTGAPLAALTTVPYIHSVWGSGPAVAAAAFAWVGLLAVATDLKTRKVPWDVSHPVAAVGVAAFALNYTFEGLLAFAAATLGAVGVPLIARALTNKGLGMSDIRLLWAATATTSWWAGQTWLLYALIAAALIQMVVRSLAKPLNWGAMVPVHPDRPAPEDGNVAMRRELPFAPALIFSILAMTGYATYTGYGACLMWNILGTC